MTFKRNLVSSWVSHATTLVIGLFLVRYVKDMLGDAGYGAWIFINSIANYAGLLYIGFGAAVSRYTARYFTLQDWPALNRVLSSVFLIYLTNGFVAMAAAGGIAAIAPWLSDWEGQSLGEVRLAIGLLGLNAAIGLWGSIFGGVLIGIQRFDVYRGIQIFCALLRLGLFMLALQWRPTVLAMASAYVAVTIVENGLYLLAVCRLVPQLRLSRQSVSRAALGECFSFTAFNAVALVSDYVIGLTDTIVIGCMLGTAATVPYYIALRLCQMIRIPLDQLAEILLPKSAELQTRNRTDRLKEIVLRAYSYSLLLVSGVALGGFYFGDRVLRTWLGPGQEPSLPILFILLGVQVIALPLRIPKMTLVGLGHVRAPALFDSVQAVANLVLSLVLVQRWGIVGVAWGTLIPAAVIEIGLLVPYACRTLGVRAREIAHRAILPQIAPLAALWLYCDLVSHTTVADTWLNLVIITLLGGLLLLAVRLAESWGWQRWRQRSAVLTQEALVP